MLRPSFHRRMPPTALACLGGALIPTMNIMPLTRWTSRSPATPVPYSFQQRHRAKILGSNARLGTVPCQVSQSRFLGESSGGGAFHPRQRDRFAKQPVSLHAHADHAKANAVTGGN